MIWNTAKMAATLNWTKHLNFHSLFETLRKKKQPGRKNNESQNIISVKDGELFVWNQFESCVYTTNLKHLIGKPDDIKKSTLQVVTKNKCCYLFIVGLSTFMYNLRCVC